MLHSNRNSAPATLPLIGSLVLLIGGLAGGAADAGVRLAPGGAIVFASSESKAGPTTDTHSASAPGFASWSATVESQAEHHASGAYSSGQTYLQTHFEESNFAVVSNGLGSATGGGTAAGGALVAAFFFIDTVQVFFANSYRIDGSYPNRLLSFIANLNHGETPVIPLVAGPGFTSISGRLPPGAYVLYMQNSFGPESDSGDMTTFSTGIGFINCTNPLINQQPGNQVVRIHHTATISIGTSGPAPMEVASEGAMTFQWRKGLQNLSDDGRISGTQTSQLVITDAAMSDSGLYDCVVKLGPDVEPSSLMHLTVDNGTTDVPAMGAVTKLRMAVPSPSPFGDRTQVRFSLPRAAEAGLDVLDVNGRGVRRLLPRGFLSAGAHSVTWDGRDESGARSPAGIYFLRLASGADQVVQRVVSLGGSR